MATIPYTEIDGTKFQEYKRTWKTKCGGTGFEYIYGLDAGSRMIHKWLEFNTFEAEPSAIPEGFERTKAKERLYLCNPARTKELHEDNEFYAAIAKEGAEVHRIKYNGGRPFLVYVYPDRVDIYKPPGNDSEYFVPLRYQRMHNWAFIIPVASYRYDRVFVGEKSCTVLIQINWHRYVFVGNRVVEFTIDDDITDYCSMIGNSGVPYPVALSENWCYFLYDNVGISLDSFNVSRKALLKDTHAYSCFYGHEPGAIDKKPKTKRFADVIVIDKGET